MGIISIGYGAYDYNSGVHHIPCLKLSRYKTNKNTISYYIQDTPFRPNAVLLNGHTAKSYLSLLFNITKMVLFGIVNFL